MVGFGMAIPDVQLRAQEYIRANPAIQAFPYKVEGIIIGLLLTSYFMIQLIASPRWGKLSDRIGRKPVFLVCTALSSLSMVIYAFVPSLIGILIARILGGLAAANVVVGQAYLADLTDERERGAAMGRSSSALLLGLVAGPAIGGHLAATGGSYLLGTVAATMSALACVAILIWIPWQKPTEERAPGVKNFGFDLSLLRDIPALRRILVIAVSGWFVLACLEGTFGRLIQHTLGYGQREFGWLFSYESLFAAGIGLIYGFLSNRISVGWMLRIGFISVAVGVALTPVAPNLLGLALASSFWAFGLGLANPTINTYCSAITPEDRQGEVFGLIQSSRSIGFIVGPILGGVLFDLLPALPYYFAAAVAFVAALFVGSPKIAKKAAIQETI